MSGVVECHSITRWVGLVDIGHRKPQILLSQYGLQDARRIFVIVCEREWLVWSPSSIVEMCS